MPLSVYAKELWLKYAGAPPLLRLSKLGAIAKLIVVPWTVLTPWLWWQLCGVPHWKSWANTKILSPVATLAIGTSIADTEMSSAN